ncbi:alpha/beta hydrolase [Aldersonia sp. NBC_00410]|uniref:alpha/beta fold hydrolase n=1 Tax=Aldersonia sp. NBC_00410 TaxID=2975954 RepID=UPI0022590998|nr:alpha/beta hydrolase [Aldersonia sp. NBC_00410]MCX5042359.1 alpha/beta hydrolase [Aldersonia sp. NBC_00410]
MAHWELRTIKRGALSLHYYIAGSADFSGSTIVLLHGFPQDLKTWEPISRKLSSNYCIIVPLQRGYSMGASPWNPFRYRLSELRNDIATILDAEGAGPANIVGHDWGGSVAWSLARERPELVRRLVVLSMPEPRALARAFFGKQAIRSGYMLLLMIPFFPEMLVTIMNGKFAVKLLEAMGLNRIIGQRYVRNIVENRGGRCGPFNWYRALPFNLPEALSKVIVVAPTLHIWSIDDAAVDFSGIRESQQWVRSYDLEIIEGSHWIPERDPDLVVQLIRRHLESGEQIDN